MLCRHGLPDVIMVSGKDGGKRMAERNTHTSGICLVWSVGGELHASTTHPCRPQSPHLSTRNVIFTGSVFNLLE
jgi:hypothetical protein